MDLVVFGTGNFFSKKKKYLLNNNIVAYIDNNVNLIGKDIDGILIHKVEDVKNMIYDYIVLMSLNTKEMKNQLLDYGVESDKILLFEDYCAICLKEKKYIASECYDVMNAKKINVLLVVPVVDESGVPIANIRLADVLVHNGYNITIFAPYGETRLIDEIVKKGINVYLIPSLLSYKHFDNDICEYEYDFIIVNSPGNWPFVAKYSWKYKINWWFHDPQNVHENEIDKIEDCFKNILEENKHLPQIFCDENINLFAVSEVARNIYVNTFGKLLCKEVEVLPYALSECEEIDSVERTEKLVFAVIGYATYIKGQDIFVKAIKKMRYSDRAEFWIIGNFDESTHFCKEILNDINELKNVKIKGVVPYDQMQKLYSEISVVVSSSRQDMLPTVLAEGMQHKKICITSDSTGMTSYIDDMKNGFVFESGNEKDLADKMDYIICNYDDLDYIANNGYLTYREFFSEEILYDRVLRMINSDKYR